MTIGKQNGARALGASISHRSSRDNGLKTIPALDPRLDRDMQVLIMATRVLPMSVSHFLEALIQDLKQVYGLVA